MIAGTLLVVLTGIFLPGILIEGQERKAVGEVQAVPAQYIASDSLLAKEASESLKLNDRIQLITGQWESETQEAYSYEMTLKDSRQRHWQETVWKPFIRKGSILLI